VKFTKKNDVAATSISLGILMINNIGTLHNISINIHKRYKDSREVVRNSPVGEFITLIIEIRSKSQPVYGIADKLV